MIIPTYEPKTLWKTLHNNFHDPAFKELYPGIHTRRPVVPAVPAITDNPHQHWARVGDNNKTGAGVSLI